MFRITLPDDTTIECESEDDFVIAATHLGLTPTFRTRERNQQLASSTGSRSNAANSNLGRSQRE